MFRQFLLVLILMINQYKSRPNSELSKRKPEMLDSLSRIPLKMIQLGKRSTNPLVWEDYGLSNSHIDGEFQWIETSIESSSDEFLESKSLFHKPTESLVRKSKRRPEMLNSLSRVPLRMIQLG